MIKFYLIVICLIAVGAVVNAQDSGHSMPRDSTKQLEPVVVRGYLSTQPVLSVPASVSVLNQPQLKLQPDNSFVSALNTVPGVRMEERSPGSYRLSIRGSLLRSPFGIRDVKIYYDEIPLTDAGGNSYLNAIDINGIKSIEILKGPDGSLFGANSGGVVLLNPVTRYIDSNYVTTSLNGGSYGLLHEIAAVQQRWKNYSLMINQGYQSYGGYRQNSYMHRNFMQTVNRLQYGAKNELRVLAFYSNLGYETPGGLTLSQALADPTLARLPTKTIPGALDQKIGVTTKMLLGGVVNEVNVNDQVKNVLAIYGNHVDFANPFITNYEQRSENTYGLRTYFELAGVPKKDLAWKIHLGLEWQQTKAHIGNYGNRAGVKDTAQTIDQINTNQHFIFARYAADFYWRLHMEAAVSLNYYSYKFQNIYPLAQTAFTPRDFTPQLMPRLAFSYQLTNNFIWRASVSRGYSTPTTSEVRPTDNIINTGLQAQYGWNYETGFRLRNLDETMLLDASVFFYILQNAIVRRLNPDETEYYINAGGTNQPGFELSFTDWLVRQNNSGFVRGLQFNTSVSYSPFKFTGYMDAANNYSGNQLTGVPGQVIVSGIQVKFPQSLYVFVQHNYTSRIPLNDANTVFANHYNLLQAKAGWQHLLGNKYKLEIYAGGDNLLNEHYSLGNDLNAVGNRYYNPSPLRNYYAGFAFKF